MDLKLFENRQVFVRRHNRLNLFKSRANKTVENLLHEDVRDDTDADEEVKEPEHVEYEEEPAWQDTCTRSDNPTT